MVWTKRIVAFQLACLLGTTVIALPSCLWAADHDAALIVVLNRLERMQNFTARAEVQTTNVFDTSLLEGLPLADQQAIRANIEAEGTERVETEKVVFRFLNHAAKMETARDVNASRLSKSALANAMLSGTTSVLKDRTETLVRFNDGPHGLIQNRMPVPEPWTIDVGVGIRLLAINDWITDAEVQMADRTQSNPTELVLRIKGVVGELHEMRFARAQNYAMTHYSVQYSERRASETIECSDFRPVGELLLPFRISRRSSVQNPKGEVVHPITREIIVESYVLNDPENTEENLHITWDAGMQPFDQRNRINVAVGPTSRPLTDQDIADQIKKDANFRENANERAAERIKQLSP